MITRFLAPHGLELANSRPGDYAISIACVASALLLRTGLEEFGNFFYLPLVPAVMITAIITGRRGPTLLAVILGISSNVLQVQREGAIDALLNALLFMGVCWLVAEMCWRLSAMQARAARLSERLAQDNRMLDAILASTPVVTLDGKGRVRMVTPPACEILGLSQTEGVGRPFADFVQAFTMDYALGGGGEAVWMGRRPDGRTYPLSIQCGLVTDVPEGPCVVLSLTDLTQAHEADVRARDLNTQLGRVWRLNSLGEMAAALAHELNQPLTAATNYIHASQAVTKKADVIGQSAAPTLELAKNQLVRAGAIIRRMRELLSHENRSLEAERVSVMVTDLHGVLGMIARNADVTIEYDIDDSVDQVRAERIQFQQAMINLVRNAVEALEGCPRGLVRVVGRPAGEDQYEIRVEDNGRGIAPEALETIFRPLMTTKSAGMGLGLSVTRTIVESHGGVLEVGRSALGGAAFSFILFREFELEDA